MLPPWPDDDAETPAMLFSLDPLEDESGIEDSVLFASFILKLSIRDDTGSCNREVR